MFTAWVPQKPEQRETKVQSAVEMGASWNEGPRCDFDSSETKELKTLSSILFKAV